jgi:hypothetical protein
VTSDDVSVYIYILSMTIIFAAEAEAEAAKGKAAKPNGSPAKRARTRNEEGIYSRFDSCASNLSSILNIIQLN